MKENASNEIKVILVGEMATGKTSLINATMGLKFKRPWFQQQQTHFFLKQ